MMKHKALLFHLFYWIVEFSIGFYYYSEVGITTRDPLSLQIIQFVISQLLKMVAFYSNYFLLRKILVKKSTPITITYVVLSALTYTTLFAGFIQTYMNTMYDSNGYPLNYCIYDSFAFVMVLLFTSSAFYFIIRWRATDKIQKALRESSYSAKTDVALKEFDSFFIAKSLDDMCTISKQGVRDVKSVIFDLSVLYRSLLHNSSPVTIDDELHNIQTVMKLIAITNPECTITVNDREYSKGTLPAGALFTPIAILYAHCVSYAIQKIIITIDEGETEVFCTYQFEVSKIMSDLEDSFSKLKQQELFAASEYRYSNNTHTWKCEIEGEI